MRRILLLSALALLIGQQASAQVSGTGLTVKSGSTVNCTECKRTPKTKQKVVEYDPVKKDYVVTTKEVENNCIHRHNLQQKGIDSLKGRVTNLEERQDADDEKFNFFGEQYYNLEQRTTKLELPPPPKKKYLGWKIAGVSVGVVGIAALVRHIVKGSGIDEKPDVPPAKEPEPEPSNNSGGNSNNNPL